MDTRSKIITRPSPAELAKRFPPDGGDTVAVHGRFEFLHASVIRQLEQAAARPAQKVLAIVFGDGSASPALLPERDRAQLVAALRAVDAVVICDEAETDALIAALGPERTFPLDESANRDLIADVLRRHEPR